MNKTKETLYFAEMGMSYNDKASDVGSYRIRTAFKNNDGKKIFLELGNTHRYNNKGKSIFDWALRVDFCFYITDDPEIDDCNHSKIAYDWKQLRDDYTYNKRDILDWINNNLNCSFKEMETLSNGYVVNGKGTNDYNLMEELTHA